MTNQTWDKEVDNCDKLGGRFQTNIIHRLGLNEYQRGVIIDFINKDLIPEVLREVLPAWNEGVEKCKCGIEWRKKGEQCPVCYEPSKSNSETLKIIKQKAKEKFGVEL